MAKRWRLLKEVGAGHIGLLSAGSLVWVISSASWAGSWTLGLALAGLGALVQTIVLTRRPALGLGVSQGLKFGVFGIGTALLMTVWREIHLAGFVVGIVCSQLMWVWASARRASGLLKVTKKSDQSMH